jgi:homoserine dehydrogenase
VLKNKTFSASDGLKTEECTSVRQESMDESKLRVGLIGFGTVGTGVAKLLLEEADEIAARTGVRLELACVIDKDTAALRQIQLPAGLLSDNIERLLNDPTIDVGIELVGGTTAARQIHHQLLRAGKHIVTANKALLAEYGPELYTAALETGKCIGFEASCCGGIPIILAIRTGLAANRIFGLYGIFNGTCNYILTKMTQSGADFKTVLAEAQAKGYAEADPTLDINGTDTAHKLAILGGLAFRRRISINEIYTEGIERIEIEDIRNAREMGYVIKLLAIGEQNGDGSLSLRVHPSLVHQDNPLAAVSGPFNAVSVHGHAVGRTMFYGRGAGMMATASAVVADLIEIGLGSIQRIFRTTPMVTGKYKEISIKPIENIECRFYIRLMAKDEPGVVAKYGRILASHKISIRGAIQHEGRGPDNTVPVVITTHPTLERNMSNALEELSRLKVISGRPVCIRIVDIPEDSE